MLDDIILTSIAEKLWTDLFENKQAVYKYIGTRKGVIRMFPFISFEPLFDPRDRDW